MVVCMWPMSSTGARVQPSGMLSARFLRDLRDDATLASCTVYIHSCVHIRARARQIALSQRCVPPTLSLSPVLYGNVSRETRDPMCYILIELTSAAPSRVICSRKIDGSARERHARRKDNRRRREDDAAVGETYIALI